MSTQIQELIAAETKASSIVAEARAGEEHRQNVARKNSIGMKICFVCRFTQWHRVASLACAGGEPLVSREGCLQRHPPGLTLYQLLERGNTRKLYQHQRFVTCLLLLCLCCTWLSYVAETDPRLLDFLS